MTPGWIETRLGALENRFEQLIRQVSQITQQLRGAAQSARTAGQQYPQFGGGAIGSALYCLPSATVAAATGTWPSLSPASFTADVYASSGSTLSKIATSATIYNFFPASLAASKVCFVQGDGAGNYNVVTQSCT